VRRDIATTVRLLAVPTIVLVVVIGFLPGRAGLAVRVYALILCAVAIGFALRALGRAYPAATPLRRPVKRADARRRPPGSLARIEHDAAIGVAGASDLHHRLRPRLRALAEGLLASRRRTSLDRDPDAARAVLGEATWELVRHDRPAPHDRRGRGLSLAELNGVVDSLEQT
jgi:hypothetical protein